MKKLLTASFTLALLLIATGCTDTPPSAEKPVNCTKQNLNSAECQKCIKAGGKLVQHSFGSNCEIEAKDAGKKCTYDEDCSKGQCLYENKDAPAGQCDGYLNDGEGVEQCHRRKGEAVKCYLQMSSIKSQRQTI